MIQHSVHWLTSWLIRCLLWPASLLSYPAIHRTGQILGTAAYYLLPKFRKRTLSNLALAKSFCFTKEELIATAKCSFQNLMITCLEYAKLAKEKKISRIVHCENPEETTRLIHQKKAIIFFCGHQANWELIFLEGTSRIPCVAIGRPIKNTILYSWVLNIREKFGGKMIEPRNAVKEGFKAIKRGIPLGIVGDQGMPDSGFVSDFLGRKAYTSPLPAILSYRTGAPIVVATIRRTSGHYVIHYSDPIYPDVQAESEKEIARLMHHALELFETSIKEHPDQWLWQHNRWKQQSPGKVKRPFRQDAIQVCLPKEAAAFDQLQPHLSTFRTIYPQEHLTFIVPEEFKHAELPPDAEYRYYRSHQELFCWDYAPKLLFNFSGIATLSKHFLKLSVFHALSLEDLQRLAGASATDNLTQILHKALCHAR